MFKARIFTYGYDAPLSEWTSVTYMRRHSNAKLLLSNLVAKQVGIRRYC